MAIISVALLGTGLAWSTTLEGQGVLLPESPEVRAKDQVASLTLKAVNADGRDGFEFKNATVAPVIRVSPGDTLKIDYVNHLPKQSAETCAIKPCMDMTNLHFHGLTVSPNAPQDDVLGMLAKPGEILHYRVRIPDDRPPGLFWYHTHSHGESHRQVLDGMSGAIVVEGMARYVPELRYLRERVLIVRGRSLERDASGAELTKQLDISSAECGSSPEPVEEVFTVNGVIRPRIGIAPGERQFWRVVNASADRYLDLQIDGQPLEIVALDGMPLAYHNPEAPKRAVDQLLVAPAGRLEAIVTGPSRQAHAVFRTLCVDTGPAGDANPGMVLADLVPPDPDQGHTGILRNPMQALANRPTVYKPINVDSLKRTAPDFTVVFTEDKDGFYINGRKFTLDASPMTVARVGTLQHWRIGLSMKLRNFILSTYIRYTSSPTLKTTSLLPTRHG